MSAERDDERVDRLRQQLRSLGYLDAGVDRFVLGAARDRRRPTAIAALASMRIGMLAALVTGPAAALGIAWRIPGLITGPRDGFVMALYTGALFGAGVSLASFLATLLIAGVDWRRERWRRAAALAAGLVVAAGSLAYLTLWWNVSAPATDAGFRGLGSTWLALALVAAVSLTIGHAVTVAALAVGVARGTPGMEGQKVPGTSRATMMTAGMVGFAGALLLFHVTAGSGGSSDAPPLVVVSSGARIRLIAIDGFDPGIAKRLADAGRIPALAAALALGDRPGTPDVPAVSQDTAIATVRFDDTLDPARVWTTLATGHTADTHAVRGLETRRVLGVQGALSGAEHSPVARTIAAASDLVRLTRPSIVSRDERQVKSLWEIASAAGLHTAVVNWWASWPAPPDSGIVITDRAALRLERGGELDGEIAPLSLYDTLRTRWPELRRQAAAAAALLEGDVETEVLQRSGELDALQLAIAHHVTGPTTDLTCVYLPGLDLVQHRILSTPASGAPSPSSVAAGLVAIERYYWFLDRILAPALTPQDGETVMLLASPGRVRDAPPGLFSVRGADANRLAREAIARPSDIAPTVLYALGIPVSRELAGRPVVELFSADFARRYPVREVSTYGRPAPNTSVRDGTPLDQEMIERLRSLGYIR